MRGMKLVALLVAAASAASAQRVELQEFDDGQIEHPFFSYVFDFDDDCCRRVEGHDLIKGMALHLVPNSVVVTFQTAPGEVVDSISVSILDFEGGFVGTLPTSAVVVRGRNDDFVVLHASELCLLENVSVDRHAPGQLTGEPIGPIFELGLQAANESNAICGQLGAFFDDMRAVVLDACIGDLNGDRQVDLGDLAGLLANFGSSEARFDDGDFDADGDVDLADLTALLSAFGQACD